MTNVNRLSCAARDARALHAVFDDAVGAGGALLLDEEATLAAIREALGELERSSPDDVVVFFFSGHRGVSTGGGGSTRRSKTSLPAIRLLPRSHVSEGVPVRYRAAEEPGAEYGNRRER